MASLLSRQRGFSLIEVLIAGAIMLCIVLAVQQLLASTSKGAGDLEKRLRHRDLVNDIRHLFFENTRCLELVRSWSFREGHEVQIPITGKYVGAGTDLPEYGLRVTKFTLRNVRNIHAHNHNLLSTRGEHLGTYQESGNTADLYLEAQLMGSLRPLKAIAVQRITLLRRTGQLNEEICVGNHDVTGRSLASSGGSAGFSPSSTPAYYGNSSDPPLPPPSPGAAMASVEEAREIDYCLVEDHKLRSKSGRSRIYQNEQVRFTDEKGQANVMVCNAGRISFLR